jgi:hypothetical protein
MTKTAVRGFSFLLVTNVVVRRRALLGTFARRRSPAINANLSEYTLAQPAAMELGHLAIEALQAV